MVSDIELSNAMLLWVQSVAKHLGNIPLDASTIGLGRSGWLNEQDGRIVLGVRNVQFKPWSIEKLLYENEEWETLEKLTQKHARMAMHCDTLVGTPYHGASQHSAKDFCCRLLPRPYICDQSYLIQDVEGTSGRVTELIGEFNADHITMKTVWPVRGMRVSQPIYLDNEQSFRPLTLEEKVSALNFGIIKIYEGQTTIDPSLTDWFGFVLTERFEKQFGNSDIPEDFMEKYNRREKHLELFLSVAPVVGEFVAYHGGGYAHAPHFSSLGSLSRGETGVGGGNGGSQFLIPELSPMLTEEQATRFANIWNLVSCPSRAKSKSAKALRNAILRVFYAETRYSSEDRLVDLMIAAESIYTMESSIELSFRLSLNAALWHDGTNLERRAAFEEMKHAYRLRSKIVHGSVVDANEVALAASSVRKLLKAGIAKALDSHFSGDFPPKWEDLAFPTTE